MIHTPRLFFVAAVAASLSAGTALAQNQTQTQEQAQPRTQQQMRDRDIYGYQLMTPQERDAYRERMRNARTLEEREQIRAEHHAQMQARAKERGLALPDQPRPGAGSRGAGGGTPGAGRR